MEEGIATVEELPELAHQNNASHLLDSPRSHRAIGSISGAPEMQLIEVKSLGHGARQREEENGHRGEGREQRSTSTRVYLSIRRKFPEGKTIAQDHSL